DRHLLVRMRMRRRLDPWLQAETAHHQLLADDHLPLDAVGDPLYRDAVPVTHQNDTRAPSWIWRMLRALRIFPNVAGAARLVPGLLRLTMLKTLVASIRNWNIDRPFSGTSRKIPRSAFRMLGPLMMLRPELPSVPMAGVANAAVLNQPSISTSRG